MASPRRSALAAAAAFVVVSFSCVAGTASAAGSMTSNWAGYVATGTDSVASSAGPAMRYTDVTGRWTQPRAICKQGVPSSVGIWVGLGGYSVEKLEQVGTAADCDAEGRATYYVWYELVPAGSVDLKMKIRPGDVIASSVAVDGTEVRLQVNDQTRHVIFSRHLKTTSPDLSSAEWIVEAPARCFDGGYCPRVALTRFMGLAFTRTYARGNGARGTISSPTWTSTALQLIPRGAGALPSALTPDGSGFTVTWQANPGAAAAAASAAALGVAAATGG